MLLLVAMVDPAVIDDPAQCPRVRNYVEGQISASLAQGTLEEHNNLTTEVVDDIIEQIRRRDEYDREYVANKTRDMEELQAEIAADQERRTNEIMSALNASYALYTSCISGPSCGQQSSLFGIVDGLSLDILDDLDGMNTTFNTTDNEVSIFIDKFERAMRDLVRELDRIRKFRISVSVSIYN